jgi:hypothetical protein
MKTVSVSDVSDALWCFSRRGKTATLESLREYLRDTCGAALPAVDHALVQALLAGAIELRPARLVTGKDTNTYMVFARE